MGSVHRHKHVGPTTRSGRRAARGLVALLVLSVAAGATVGGSASASSADEDPQRVLQSVSVGVGPDGSITDVDSTSISKTDSSDLTSTEDSFDPATVAGGLPVRILTSYRLGDRSGTDLSEIAGESGRVVVEVVVQNTTVRPQKLTYDVGSSQRTQFALVAAPLTVVATADLGSTGLTRVVTDDGSGGGTDAVTNGVLSRTEDGAVQVQWASLLAPPRLSPSVTFRLVQDTDDFEVPSFDINVQPGLVTDTSVQNLLEAAFSEDAGSTLQLEGRTIALIGQVTGALEVASEGLSDIEQLLDTSAQTIGQRTIADLTSSSDSITDELRGLAGDLSGLNADIDTQLEKTRSSTLSQLSTTVEAIKSRLGDPARTPTPPPVTVTGCAFDVSDNLFGADATVFAQLLRVRSQLTAIGDATRKCSDALAEDLRAAIGSTDASYVCDDESQALICALGETKASITEKAVDLSRVGTNVAGRFEADRLDDLRTNLDDFNDTFAGVRATASELAGGEVSVGPLVQTLLDLRNGLIDLQAALQPGASNSIPATLRGIHDQALVAANALGTGGGAASVSDQARAAADAACSLTLAARDPDPDPVPTSDDRDLLSALLVGTTCAGADADVPTLFGGLSVAERADSALAAVTDISGLSDLDDPANPVAAQLSGLGLDVGNLLTLVGGVISGNAADLQQAVNDLSEELTSLGSGIDLLPTDSTCPADATGPEDDLTGLNRSFRRLYCKQAGLESYISEQFTNAGGVLDQVQDDLADGQSTANAARIEARDAVTDTTDALSKRLDRAGNALRDKGAREIAEQRRRLDSEVETVTRLLSNNIATAVSLIDNRVRTANGDLDESQRRLVADLARVLTDIGDGRRNGAGLLGALASGASETRLSNQAIVRVSDTAGAFRNLRSAAMEDTLLQQAQLARSLELQQELPVLGLTLPPGSRYVGIYSFHVGEG